MNSLTRWAACLGALLCGAGTVRGVEHRFRYYTDTEGLSSNTIQCIYQDDKGYVWAGTADGLDRFNSCDFTSYRSDYRVRHTLANNCVYSLCGEAMSGGDRIWVGTGDGIYVFDTRCETFVDLPVEVDGEVRRNLLVYSLAADVRGNMWIGTLGDGLFRYDLRRKTFEHYSAERYPEAFSSNVIPKILLDADNNVWVASGGGSKLCRYNPENNGFSVFRVEDTLTREPISRISTMMQDSFGDIWIAGYACELYKFELARRTFTSNRPADGERCGRVRAMIEYAPGVLMLGTDHGLVAFDAKNRSFGTIDDGATHRNGRLNDQFVHSMLKDRDGGIWIGTYFGGLNYLSPFSSLFTAIEPAPGCGRIISKFCEGPQGNIWIGSDDGGLSLYDPRTGSYSHVTIDPQAPPLNIHALLLDGERLWVGTYDGGLYRVDLRTRRADRRFTPETTGLANLDVYSLFRDSRGVLWIGTKMGICRYDDARQTIDCALELGHNSDVVDICEDRAGRLWFASLGKGLIRYDAAQERFVFLSQNPEYRLPDFVSSLAPEGDALWIGTHGNGLCRYDAAADRVTMEFDETIYGNCAVFQIVQNGGELWLTTNAGLLRYECANPARPIYKYTSEDGLPANIFNANSGIKSSTGHIYIGCNNGITKFYPYDFARRESSARLGVVFTGFRLANREVPLDGRVLTHTIDCQRRVELRGRKISFSLDFIALNYSSPLRTVYRYRLENFDDKWVTTGFDGSSGVQHVSYTNLPPASYRFVVSASNNGEQFGEEAVVAVTVLPPWWMTRAATALWCLAALAAVGAAAYLFSRRVARAHRAQIAAITNKNRLDMLEAKVDFFTDVAHEIRTPVSLICAPIEAIAACEGFTESQREDVRVIRKNCARLLGLVDRILSLRESENGCKFPPPSPGRRVDVGELLVAAIDKVRGDVERDDVTVAVRVPAERLVAALEAERFGQIVEHLVRNGFQYAERRIDVAVLGPGDGVPGDRFRLVVRDDGAGIGRKRQKRIFDPFYTTGATAAGGGLGLGLPIVRNLADRMGATIEVDSEEGGGAEFRIDFPYRAGDETLAPVAEGGSPQPAPAGDGRLAVLLVENDADFADFFFRHLSEQYDVHRAGDVRQAVESLRRGRFAAVVCNAAARGIDGEGLCAAIRADAQLACLPVVLITADAASAARVGALQAGADVCLAMPLSADCLEEQIRSLVRRRDELRLTYSKMPYRPLGEGGALSSDGRFMEQVNRYVTEHIADSNISVEDIAAAVNVSRSQFFARIKALTGTTPNEYLRSTRLKVAAELLAAPNGLRVTEICYMVGFTSASYFAKCFNARFGMVPNEYMERYRRE